MLYSHTKKIQHTSNRIRYLAEEILNKALKVWPDFFLLNYNKDQGKTLGNELFCQKKVAVGYPACSLPNMKNPLLIDSSLPESMTWSQWNISCFIEDFLRVCDLFVPPISVFWTKDVYSSYPMIFLSLFMRMDGLHSTSILHGWKILLADASWLNFNCTGLRWRLCHVSTENLDETLYWSVIDRLFVRVLEWFVYICIQEEWEFGEPEYTTMIWILLLQNIYN